MAEAATAMARMTLMAALRPQQMGSDGSADGGVNGGGGHGDAADGGGDGSAV